MNNLKEMMSSSDIKTNFVSEVVQLDHFDREVLSSLTEEQLTILKGLIESVNKNILASDEANLALTFLQLASAFEVEINQQIAEQIRCFATQGGVKL